MISAVPVHPRRPYPASLWFVLVAALVLLGVNGPTQALPVREPTAPSSPAFLLSCFSKDTTLNSLELQERVFSISENRVRGFSSRPAPALRLGQRLKEELIRVFAFAYGEIVSGRLVVSNNPIDFRDPLGLFTPPPGGLNVGPMMGVRPATPYGFGYAPYQLGPSWYPAGFQPGILLGGEPDPAKQQAAVDALQKLFGRGVKNLHLIRVVDLEKGMRCKERSFRLMKDEKGLSTFLKLEQPSPGQCTTALSQFRRGGDMGLGAAEISIADILGMELDIIKSPAPRLPADISDIHFELRVPPGDLPSGIPLKDFFDSTYSPKLFQRSRLVYPGLIQ